MENEAEILTDVVAPCASPMGALAQYELMSYRVDARLKEELGSLSYTANRFAHGYVETKEFVNDSIIHNSLGSGRRTPVFPRVKNLGDSILILSEPWGIVADAFLVLSLYKDSCSVDLHSSHMIVSDSTGMFRYRKKSLTFIRKPVLRKGEIIEGVVDLVTFPYDNFLNGYDEGRAELREYFRFVIP